jgi:hypothetical protein
MSLGRLLISAAIIGGIRVLQGLAAEPQVIELTFDHQPRQTSQGTNVTATWVTAVEQDGGEFIDEPPCWHVENSQPLGRGRLVLSLDRQSMREDLAMAVLCEENENADMAVQLFDEENRVVALDLFSNIVAVGRDAKTDTFIIPLRKYPHATKILLRRIAGDIKVYGLVLYPVVSESETDLESGQKLALMLGDPLNPENPLCKRLKALARDSMAKVENSQKVRTTPSAPELTWKKGREPVAGPPVVLVDGSTKGYYNSALERILDGSQAQFPRPGLETGYGPGRDPTILPSAEPDLRVASSILGNWLTSKPFPLDNHWSGLCEIPPTWKPCTETAILYPIQAGAYGIANVRANFEVDNGIYVWVNGKFKFGARAPGLPSPDSFEYANIDLGTLTPGLNFIQVLREDEGIATGYRVRITGIMVGTAASSAPPALIGLR